MHCLKDNRKMRCNKWGCYKRKSIHEDCNQNYQKTNIPRDAPNETPFVSNIHRLAKPNIEALLSSILLPFSDAIPIAHLQKKPKATLCNIFFISKQTHDSGLTNNHWGQNDYSIPFQTGSSCGSSLCLRRNHALQSKKHHPNRQYRQQRHHRCLNENWWRTTGCVMECMFMHNTFIV